MNPNKDIKGIFIALLFAAVLLLALTGCDSSKSAPAADNASNAENADQGEESGAVEGENGLDSLTQEQRTALNILNYMSYLTQRINNSSGDPLFLETVSSSLFNNTYWNSVDKKTQEQISNLLDTIKNYRMIEVNRKRLSYIYEQKRAQALKEAVPNPSDLLGIVQSGSQLQAAASALSIVSSSVSSYQSAASQAAFDNLTDGWKLDDEESEALHNSTKDFMAYVHEMVHTYNLEDDYILTDDLIGQFVNWSSLPEDELANKVKWLESNQETYQAFGLYWLELAKDYYNSKRYADCLEAIRQYEDTATRIFRKDADYAQALPMAIVSAKETMDDSDYVKAAEKYCSNIFDNTDSTDDSDWSLRYFAAQVYLDLYAITNETTYLENAYDIVYDNVNLLIGRQRELNESYRKDIKLENPDNYLTKREKDEVNNYNDRIKEERKTALPPVSEALYLNCDLLFALAEQKNISSNEQSEIDSILHGSGDKLFLTEPLDRKFRFEPDPEPMDTDEITFDGEKLTIPATWVSDRSEIIVTVSGASGSETIDDWTVKSVKRPKNADPSGFIATFESKTGNSYKYQAGDTVIITIFPIIGSTDEQLVFQYDVVEGKNVPVLNGVKFERVKE